MLISRRQEGLVWYEPLGWVPRIGSGILVPLVESAEGYRSLLHRWEKNYWRTWVIVLRWYECIPAVILEVADLARASDSSNIYLLLEVAVLSLLSNRGRLFVAISASRGLGVPKHVSCGKKSTL